VSDRLHGDGNESNVRTGERNKELSRVDGARALLYFNVTLRDREPCSLAVRIDKVGARSNYRDAVYEDIMKSTIAAC